MEATQGTTIREVASNDSIKSAKETNKADLYVKTGQTGGRRFLVSVVNKGARPTLIALHL